MSSKNLNKNPNLSQKGVIVAQRILSKNDNKANELREEYAKKNIFVINLMSSPGSGKTSFLEQLAKDNSIRFCVLEGDLETNLDAARLEDVGIKAHQITTGEACHLDAFMVEDGLKALDSRVNWDEVDYLFIENVGNLVCPASYDLGAMLNVVFLSSAEGDDKVLKYPSMFLCADALVISKADLCEIFEFDVERVRENLARLGKHIEIFLLDSKRGRGVQEFMAFIERCKVDNFCSDHVF